MSFSCPVLIRLIASLMVAVLLTLGVMGSALATTLEFDEVATEQCICAAQGSHHASLDSFLDVSEETTDQEQLLHPSSDVRLPALNSGRDISYQASFWPRRAATPLFRPPSFAG